MSTKRIVLIIMCSLLAVMVTLMIIVFSQFAPFLNMLRPAQKPVIQAPSSSTVPAGPQTTTGQILPTLPSQPPIVTQPGHIHDFQFTQKVDPTCDSPGYSLYTCSCNMLDMRDITDALGHTYGAGKKVVFCEEEGYTEYVCIICNYADRQNITAPPGHDYRLVKTEEPTCTEDGYELHRCSRCDDEKQENLVPAPGHTDFDWVQNRAPGVDEPGEEVRQCSVCQFRETRDCEMTVTGVEPEDLGDRMEYIIHVGTKDTPRALRYSVKDYSKADLNIEYTGDGLLITNTGDSTKQILLAPLKNESVTIDSDGKPSGSIPTVPPTQPSTSTATPSTPTGTQPTAPTVPNSTPSRPPTETQPTVPTVPGGTQASTPDGSQPTTPTVPGSTQASTPGMSQPTVPSYTGGSLFI